MAPIHCSPISVASRRSAARFLLPQSICRARPSAIAPRPRQQPHRPVSSTSRRPYQQPADNPDFHSILDNPPELVRSGRRHGPGLIILAIIPLTAFGLGTWQVYRLKWKTDLLAKCEDRLVRPPLPLPPRVDPAAVDDFDYRRVYVTGHFRHDQEMLIGPRMRDGEQGYMVVTPLEPIVEQDQAPRVSSHGDSTNTSLWQRVSGFFWRSPDSSGSDATASSAAPQVADPPPPAVLVNRGWISKKLGNQKERPESLPDGPITVEGMIRKPWKKNMFTPGNRPDIGEFYFPDVEQMANLTGSQPIWIESTMEPGLLEVLEMQRKGIPIGRAAEVNLRNNHAQYIFTWYALAAATSIMFYLVVKKPPKDVTRRVRKNYSW